MSFTNLLYLAKRRFVTYKIVSVFNPLFNLFIGGDRRPIYFDIDQTFPALRIFEQHYAEIRAELDNLLPHQHQMPRYHDIDDDLLYASGRYNRDKHWNVFMLYCYGEKPEFNRELCPRTCELLDAIPNLCQGFFSILDAGKSIPRHTSPSRYYLRYHLGLKVPRERPPAILLRDTRYTWKEGEAVLFDDSWDHEIVNHASEPRAVLIVDVLRPMPQPAHALGRLIMLLARWVYAVKTHKRVNQFSWNPD
ncbi:aspartyl/Asparaginyl beta-hydroxylase family protein [Janthinobacterium agaricidamnosum NBRC 102515 = DSM 9628]|uniref:Aspartyl/Asparaginyl beta-hydroxylase family protein n=2 Tax=Janthinobacterium agaricidamnosum TaxID=55508 RepID=W0V316_9BURK|nr:aspartyl/Asparaginyl beta-hydroxylase family protein [Janthinobacterium agaricidamnosum NBRC 102515 = DSM 9628]